jgi:hypothetical protein
MDIMIRGLAFAVAALCAVTMGFAIQRGATCTVAAVDEVIARRGVKQLVALFEASAWVAGGLLIARGSAGSRKRPRLTSSTVGQ